MNEAITMLGNPRNIAAHKLTREAPVLREVNHNGVAEDSETPVQVVDHNEVALAHHRQGAAHKDRIGADPADDKLI